MRVKGCYRRRETAHPGTMGGSATPQLGRVGGQMSFERPEPTLSGVWQQAAIGEDGNA